MWLALMEKKGSEVKGGAAALIPPLRERITDGDGDSPGAVPVVNDGQDMEPELERGSRRKPVIAPSHVNVDRELNLVNHLP